MAIGVSSNYSFEGAGQQTLEPGIYEGKFTSIELGTKYNTQTKEDEPSVLVTFVTTDGKKHINNEKLPVEEEKQVSMLEKLLHILGPGLSVERKAEIGKMSFEDMEEIVEFVGTELKSMDVTVCIKITGDAISGNRFTRLPNFSTRYTTPFVASLADSNKIKFTKGELEGIAKYEAAAKAAAPKESGSGEDKASGNASDYAL